MDRNIVTRNDAIKTRKLAQSRAETPEMRDGAAPMEGGLDTTIRPDAWFERLAKYIPTEALCFYLGLAGLVMKQDLIGSRGIMILQAVLAIAVLFNTLYLRLVWKVKRWVQIAISDAALCAYAFASGGLLIQQLSFFEPRIGTAAVVVTSGFLMFVDPPSPQS